MPATPYAFQSTLTWAEQIRRREISCVEALQFHLDRVSQFNKDLNAVVAFRVEEAMRFASESDAALARGEVWGALHGVPMTVKESFDVAGMETTWGVSKLVGSVAATDSAAVGRLKGSGANIFGKTNVPAMLADWQTFNPIYGATSNPWDLTRAPGGSSGGAAAALASALTPLELGSDIGASIRNPAHYCGVFGHKPSYGIVSQAGHSVDRADVPLDLIVCGPMARTAEDLAVAMDLLVGPEPQCEHLRIELPKARRESLAGARIAVWLSDSQCDVDQSVQHAVRRAAEVAKDAGATVDFEARPFPDTALHHEVYLQLLRGATGPLLSNEEYAIVARQFPGLAASDQSYRAKNIRGILQSHRQWYEAHRERSRIRASWKIFFEKYDAVLCPVAASAAFAHDRETPRVDRTIPVNGRMQNYNDQLFWAGLATLSYLPATVIPVARTDAGLPIGLQVIGGFSEDKTTIEMARLLSKRLGGFVPPPAYI